MEGQNKPALVALRARREVVIDTLSTHFANDVLAMDEFEERVDLAHHATTLAQLDGLLVDLEAPTEPAPQAATRALVVRAPATEVALRTRERRPRNVLSILSGVQRKGSWRVPRTLSVVSIMGAIDLDFREAVFGPGVTEVKVIAVMGAVAIVVPPHLEVECDGLGVLGVFEGMERSTEHRDPDAPLLRITGVAVMGALEIGTRPVGGPMKLDPNATVGQLGRR